MFTPAKDVKKASQINIYHALDQRIHDAASLGASYLYLEHLDDLAQTLLNRPDKQEVLDDLIKAGYSYYVTASGQIKISWG